MNGFNEKRIIQKVFRDRNRPLINDLSLEFVMKYELGTEKEFSILLKTCFFFYVHAINDRFQYNRLRSFTGTLLPWNRSDESERWIYPGFAEAIIQANRERSIKLWFKLMDFWFEVFYMDPNFYLKWSEEDGWGQYYRDYIPDIRVVLDSKGMLYSTFVESVGEVEIAVLDALGFASFFRYDNPGTPTSNTWIVFGKLMMSNSIEDSPIWFDHLYDRADVNDKKQNS